jgi:hypothetical protein
MSPVNRRRPRFYGEVYLSVADGQWRWRVVSANGEPHHGSFDGYTRMHDAKRSFRQAHRLMPLRVVAQRV